MAIFPFVFVFAFAVHPDLLSPRFLGPSELILRARAQGVLHVAHALVTINTALMVVVALHFMRVLEGTSGAWAGIVGGALAVLGTLALADTLNPGQLVSDTLALTNVLRTRFSQDKIYLMGRSGGAFFGIQAAARAPELYRAATAPLPEAYLKVRDMAMHELGVGTTHDMKSVFTDMFLASLRHREYTLSEKVNLWRGKLFSGSRLWNTQLSTDLSKKVTRLDVPVYFLHGVHDYTVSYPMTKAYFALLNAPVKGFYTFQQSAHTPFFEEPGKTREIVRADVLTRSTALADPP